MDSQHINQWLGNGASVAAIVGTIAGILPSFAALVALIWYAIQIYESPTIQRWVASRRHRKIARLKVQLAELEAHVPPAIPLQKKDEPKI
jgi:uncharacterized membrane-anchored protein